jgi:histidine triad (HIT) family protein
MEDSIFTKIINGEIPCHKIYEDGKTLAFLDIHPSQPGHTLIIPKCQVQFLWDLEPGDYQAVMETAKMVARHLRLKLNVPYVGVKVVGLEVPHAHVHLVPFTTHAEYFSVSEPDAEPDHPALAELAKTLAF